MPYKAVNLKYSVILVQFVARIVVKSLIYLVYRNMILMMCKFLERRVWLLALLQEINLNVEAWKRGKQFAVSVVWSNH